MMKKNFLEIIIIFCITVFITGILSQDAYAANISPDNPNDLSAYEMEEQLVSQFTNTPGDDGSVTILTNGLVNSDPHVFKVGDDIVMLFLAADSNTRGSDNLCVLMYSVYDGINWSKPRQLDSNQTMDNEFDVYCDGETAVVAYQESSIEADKITDLTEYAKTMRISAAFYEKDTHTFHEPKIISDKKGYHGNVAAGMFDGQYAIAWSYIPNFSVLDTNAKHTMEISRYSEGAWTKADMTVGVQGIIDDIAVGDVFGSGMLLYSVVLDINSGVKTLYAANSYNETPVKVTSGELGNLAYTKFPGDTTTFLAWVSDGEYHLINNSNGASNALFHRPLIANGVRCSAAGNSVYYGKNGQLYRICKNEKLDRFCDPVMIYQGSENENIEFIATYVNDRAENSGPDEGFVIINTSRELGTDEFDIGYTLKMVKIQPIYGLTIDSVEYDRTAARANEYLTVNLTFTNTGTETFENIKLVLTKDGETVCNKDTYQMLSPGETTQSIFTFMPDAIDINARYLLTVEPYPENNMVLDLSFEKPSAVIDLSLCDFFVEHRIRVDAENQRSIDIIVKNNSIIPSGATVTVKDPEGGVIQSYTTEQLVRYDEQIFSLSTDGLLGDNESTMIEILVETSNGEFDYSNNTDFFLYREFDYSGNGAVPSDELIEDILAGRVDVVIEDTTTKDMPDDSDSSLPVENQGNTTSPVTNPDSIPSMGDNQETDDSSKDKDSREDKDANLKQESKSGLIRTLLFGILAVLGSAIAITLIVVVIAALKHRKQKTINDTNQKHEK